MSNTLTRRDLSYRRTHQGAWAISAMIKGYFVEMQYMGYTKEEATHKFLETYR